MPVDLTLHCQRILRDIVTTSEQIRHSALDHANSQNFQVSQELRRQLETIRISANAILEAVAEASFTDYTINDGLIDWLFSGAPQTCLEKLKEMNSMVKPVNPVRHARGPAGLLRPVEDKVSAAMVFFNQHINPFHFLITPEVWNRERLLHQPSGSESRALQTDTLPVPEGTVHQIQELLNVAEPDVNPTLTTRHQKESHRQQLEEVLRWLSALNCTDKHNYLYQLRQEGTCKWFPDTDSYGKWRRLGAQFLWLRGKAGCGKSVLIASTIEHLKTTLQYEEVVLFFYFDFQNERSRSPAEMMRSLLSQLCRHLLDLRVDPGDFPSKVLEEKSKGILSLNDLDKLCDLVSRAADRFVREPIVVIDALDECADIESLLRAILRLWHEDKVRLLMTSRPHHSMMCHLTKLPSLSFEGVATELAMDIELHVKREINHNQLKFAGPETKAEIHTKLIQKAEGRFRWVQCQIDILKRCTTAQELKKALDNLPSELETTYERILDAIDERRLEGKLARRVLVWLVVALEPLRLAQILDMLSVEFSLPRKVESAELVDMLSSLVSHHKETDVVSLSHFSVKEYLTARTTLPMYHITPCDAHSEAVRSCMHYISAFIKRAAHKNAVTLESWPMLRYALSSGFNHLSHIDPKSSLVLEALQSLGSDVRHHPSHWEHLCRLREEDLRLLYPPWPSSRHDFVLYIMIAYAPFPLFQTFLSGRRPIKARIGTNPLVYAADLRRTDHAIALLACGADLDTRGLAIDDSHYISPLEVSVDRDEDVLVGELLERGCLVTSELLSTCVCLPWCSAGVLVKLVHTPEFEEWAHAIGDERLYRGIFSSARPNAGDIKKADENHVALARRLHQIGQDLSARSRFGAELIERALRAAHTLMLEYLLPIGRPPPSRFLLAASSGDTPETVSIVRFLLQRGANINVVSRRGDTVLHLAARCPWEPRSLELMKMLTDAGRSPNVTPNSRMETPLTIAMNNDYPSVVEHLLSLDDCLPPSDTLSKALRRHNSPRIIKYLIRYGANVHSITTEGETMFHLVIANYDQSKCLELVKSFIEAGCDPNICNPMKKTVLEAAIGCRLTSVLELLLLYGVSLPRSTLPSALTQCSPPQLIQILIHNGVDVHSTSAEGESVLQLAIVKYDETTCLELVKRFIEAGCNPRIRNSTGKTVLHTAIGRGYASVVEFLLSLNDPLPHDILPFALQQRLIPYLVENLFCKGADVNSTLNKKTVLHLAVANYSEFICLELMKIFVEAGCDSNICNSRGIMVLRNAFERGYNSVVEFLLSLNDPLPRDILPFTLLQRLPSHLVQILVCKGADVNSTLDEKTVLHLAVATYSESVCLELVRKFIEVGCNPRVRDSTEKTVLQTAIGCRYTSVVEFLLSLNDPLPRDILPFTLLQRLPPHLVQILVRKGADVNSTLDEKTVLHLAVATYSESVCLELVRRFIEAGCNPRVRDSTGKTVLHTAIGRGYASVAEFLLSLNDPLPHDILPFALQQRLIPYLVENLFCKGADVNSTLDEKTVLHLAVATYSESVCLELMRRFIEAGCNPRVCDPTGKTVLQTAIGRKYTSVVEFLLSLNGPLPRDILPLILKQRSPPQLVRFAVEKGANVNLTLNGETALHLAIAEYSEPMCLELVKTFLEVGCNTTTRNSVRKTALVMAIERRYTSVVELLLQQSDTLPPGILPLMLKQRSPPALVRSVISKGANVHSTTSERKSVFHLAIAQYSEVDCLALLEDFIEAGCNPGLYDLQGETALDVTIERGYTSVAERILQCNVPLPSDILPIALRKGSTPQMIQILVEGGAQIDQDTVFQLVSESYSGREYQQIREIIDTAQKGKSKAMHGVDTRQMSRSHDRG